MDDGGLALYDLPPNRLASSNPFAVRRVVQELRGQRLSSEQRPARLELIVQVRFGRVPAVTAAPDRVPRFDPVTDGDLEAPLPQMPQKRKLAVLMVDDDIVACDVLRVALPDGEVGQVRYRVDDDARARRVEGPTEAVVVRQLGAVAAVARVPLVTSKSSANRWSGKAA